MHQDDKGFGPVPTFSIKDLFFNFVHYEFNKSDVLFVINESSFKYLNSLCFWLIESLELLYKLLLRLEVGDTPDSNRVFLNMPFEPFKRSQIKVDTISECEKLIGNIRFNRLCFLDEVMKSRQEPLVVNLIVLVDDEFLFIIRNDRDLRQYYNVLSCKCNELAFDIQYYFLKLYIDIF